MERERGRVNPRSGLAFRGELGDGVAEAVAQVDTGARRPRLPGDRANPKPGRRPAMSGHALLHRGVGRIRRSTPKPGQACGGGANRSGQVKTVAGVAPTAPQYPSRFSGPDDRDVDNQRAGRPRDVAASQNDLGFRRHRRKTVEQRVDVEAADIWAGRMSDSSARRGMPPIAAMSLTLTASAL